MSIKRIFFTAHGGRVQGVFFRAHTVQTATDLSLTGWVHNLPSGTAVQGEVQGAESDVEAFLKAVDKGPPGAHVVRLDRKEVAVKNGEEGFRKVKSYEEPPVPSDV
ncbi:acylphosphatase [Tricharina praecox]|uniref:acylphosphatase n=1 Tax=Tricharina praecox TaxID=43433 RepID=UPI00221FEC99|nr:acylphosphatase [Tricharina praecox]KAI5846757.1 acylphosphatase [Tricharina praecox]